MRARLPLIVAAVVLALVGAACGDLAQPYAAKVNGARISQGALDRELRIVLNNKQVLASLEQGIQPGQPGVKGEGSGTVTSAFAARMLSRRILLELIHQEVGRRHLAVTKARLAQGRSEAEQQFGDPKTFAGFPKAYQDEMSRANAEVAIMQEKAVAPVTDADLRRYYDQNASQFQGKCLSHILVDSKEKADALRAQIAGGASFAEVAKAESTDTRSGAQGGFLGCFPADQPLEGFVEPFKTEAEKLPIGQLSQPVQTQFGFHLIQATGSRTFEEVKGEIKTQLGSQQSQSAFNDLLLSLVKRAKIEVNPRYGRFSKDPSVLGVIPPQAPQLAPTTSTSAPTGLQIPGG
ncbi:MAG: peptidyl-prolyl cis-trans isomerase [Actinomycetota bacterium]